MGKPEPLLDIYENDEGLLCCNDSTSRFSNNDSYKCRVISLHIQEKDAEMASFFH